MNINGKYYMDAEAAAYIQSLLHIISDARSLLGFAFFADYKLQNKADEVIARSDATLKAVKEK